MTMDEFEKAETRSFLYKLLAVSFAYPTEELVAALTREEYWRDLDQLFFDIDPSGTMAEITRRFKPDISSEAAGGKEGMEIEYNRLFQLSQSLPCPLTASEYMKGESRQALAVAQLNGLYKSFGVKMKNLKEPDNLSTVLEFMSWLCAKQARAIEQGNEEHKASCLRAQEIILEDYLGWVPLLQDGIRTNAELKHYLWLVACLVEFIKLERRDLLAMAGTAV